VKRGMEETLFREYVMLSMQKHLFNALGGDEEDEEEESVVSLSDAGSKLSTVIQGLISTENVAADSIKANTKLCDILNKEWEETEKREEAEWMAKQLEEYRSRSTIVSRFLQEKGHQFDLDQLLLYTQKMSEVNDEQRIDRELMDSRLMEDQLRNVHMENEFIHRSLRQDKARIDKNQTLLDRRMLHFLCLRIDTFPGVDKASMSSQLNTIRVSLSCAQFVDLFFEKSLLTSYRTSTDTSSINLPCPYTIERSERLLIELIADLTIAVEVSELKQRYSLDWIPKRRALMLLLSDGNTREIQIAQHYPGPNAIMTSSIGMPEPPGNCTITEYLAML